MLKSPYIKSLDNAGATNGYIDQFGPLIKLIKDTNNYKGQFHDTDHLVKTAYLAYLTCQSFIRDNTAGMVNPHMERALAPELSMVVKAAMLNHYCHQNDADDDKNLAHTLSAIRTLAFEHEDIISAQEAEQITFIIEHAAYHRKKPEEIVSQYEHGNIYSDIIADCDKLYAALYFDKDLFIKFYNDIGKQYCNTIDEFIVRTKNYFLVMDMVLTTEFGKTVYHEIIDELESVCDDLYYQFPDCTDSE